MVTSSLYWKNEINKLQRRFSKLSKTYFDYSSNALYDFERDFFIAFYAIRKLSEAHTLSDKVVSALFPIIVHPHLNNKPTTLLNAHKLDELYDLDSSKQESISLRDICNQVIHSYVFQILIRFQTEDDNEQCVIEGVFLSSDKKRNKSLYYIDIQNIIDILHTIATERPQSITRIWDDKKEDYTTTIVSHDLKPKRKKSTS